MKTTATITGQIPRPIATGRLDFKDIASHLANIVFDEYSQQIPVNKGDLRRSLRKKETRDGYTVAPTLKRAIYLHEGTGRFRGSSYDFGKRGGTGRTREARYTDDEIAMFKAIAKRGGTISIPPDKFADRTLAAVRPIARKRVEEYAGKEFAKRVRI